MRVDNSRAGGEGTPSAPQQNGSVSNLFLTLLVAQIQNQDPTNPTDSADYINQLSMMSQMESMQGMKETLTALFYAGENLHMLGMSNLPGQRVFAQSERVQLDGQKVEGRFTLQHAASNVTLQITDSTGNVTTLDLGSQKPGDVPFTIDPTALGLAEGDYSLSVVTDTAESGIGIEIAGIVNSVRFDAQTGAAKLNITGLGDVDYNQLRQFDSKRDTSSRHFS